MAGATTDDGQGNGSGPHRPDADELLDMGELPADHPEPQAEEPGNE
jgi:hypothetical protein